jgi:hypothetical protein
MLRRFATKKVLAVVTGSTMILGSAALANAAASDATDDPAGTETVVSTDLGPDIEDGVVGDDQGENEDPDDQGENEDGDDGVVGDDQGENEDADDQGENEDGGDQGDDQGENEDADDGAIEDSQN